MDRKLFKQAFITSLPVLTGYLALGSAFGVLFARAGGTTPWAALMSLTVYGGSMQFAAVSMLANKMALAEIALLSIFINIRHIVYGMSLLEKFRNSRWLKPYHIFTLTDETYALLVSLQVPPGADAPRYMALIGMLNHIYWIVGGIIGTLAGSLLDFDSRGIEFTMTALFIVILTEQCMTGRNRIPALIGFAATIGARLCFGTERMLIPAIVGIITILLLMRPGRGSATAGEETV